MTATPVPSDARFTATLQYSEGLVRDAALAFLRRTVGVRFLLAMLITLGGLIVAFVQGDRSWYLGVMGTVFVLGMAFVAAVFLVHYRNAMQKLRDMGVPSAQFRAGNESFTLESGIGTTTMAWSTITEVWCYPTFWLVLFSKAQFVTVPLAGVSPLMQEFVLAKAAGAKAVIRR